MANVAKRAGLEIRVAATTCYDDGVRRKAADSAVLCPQVCADRAISSSGMWLSPEF